MKNTGTALRTAALSVAAATSALGLALAAQSPAAAADDTVPSCVKTATTHDLFGYFGAFITNDCTTEQRVLPVFKIVWSTGPQPQCHVLQPGEKATQWVKPTGIIGQDLVGLVRC
ncbi:hypothetical protein PS467_19345 [Streptomyces luomodiensis]|uniref:Uncharacterized protein n=1 Tax=Streptomyces luomodiensis TaxID=3026192 RepID=A0ABY9UXQ3_9ACTN|nr:hypothetical protein [Streptomyces sp. SCA4-21]WNE97332.1 hypothetical protein PS467_19345 [Streptomyces sp. SCA4-21]